jgi:hypothetical protein
LLRLGGWLGEEGEGEDGDVVAAGAWADVGVEDVFDEVCRIVGGCGLDRFAELGQPAVDGVTTVFAVAVGGGVPGCPDDPAAETRSAPSRRRRTRPGDLADHTTAVSAADRDLTVPPGPSPPGPPVAMPVEHVRARGSLSGCLEGAGWCPMWRLRNAYPDAARLHA